MNSLHPIIQIIGNVVNVPEAVNHGPHVLMSMLLQKITQKLFIKQKKMLTILKMIVLSITKNVEIMKM